MTTPRQRERLAVSADAISREGPLGRALDILGGAILLAVGVALAVAAFVVLGTTWGFVVLVVVVVLAALGLLGVAG
ncbi:MAG TPA: hypothetical protein VFZ89_07700 [Solirubrobacteraceae bacterium]